MLRQKARLLVPLVSVLFLLLDQWLKQLSLHTEKHLLGNWLGWFPFQNSGVAFGIPLPTAVVVIITVPVLIGLVAYGVRRLRVITESRQWWLDFIALHLIVTGAVSNAIDRIVYLTTLDYFLIVTSVINLGDVMIVAGFILLFISLRRRA